jgi:phosphodiesterase/alkaline phosphatase D-like protein
MFNVYTLLCVVVFDTSCMLRYCTCVQPVKPADANAFAQFEVAAEGRQIMSSKQMDWLTHNLKTSQQQWKVVGNQVLPLLVSTL